jgi:hypothetical protein
VPALAPTVVALDHRVKGLAGRAKKISHFVHHKENRQLGRLFVSMQDSDGSLYRSAAGVSVIGVTRVPSVTIGYEDLCFERTAGLDSAGQLLGETMSERASLARS